MSVTSRIKDFLWSLKQSRGAKIVLLVVLIAAVATLAGYVLFDGNDTATNQNFVDVNQSPNIDEEDIPMGHRVIDGIAVPLARADLFPAAIVVENLVASRPQAGLDRANVVYEMLAEGGITRFVGIFASDETIEKIGPVRSSRTPHLDVVKEYDALYAHAGGSPDALSKIQQYDIRDLNQFFNSGYYWRDTERRKTKAIEHTLYTSSELMARAFRDKEMPMTGAYDGWDFADAVALDKRPAEEKTISIDFSTFQYKVDYAYERETNTYLRKQAEAPHAMENGETVHAANVVVQYVPTRLADKEGRLAMDLVGEGEGIIFKNGEVINATWKKTSRESRTRWFDAQGEEIEFTRGNIWIEIVPSDREVSYT